MKPSLARIERFVQTWEASLAPPVDRTAWMQHLDNRDEMQRHLAAHPRDVAMAQWLAWLWDERPSGETAVLPSHVALRRPAAPPATDTCGSVEKPEPKKPQLKAEPKKPELRPDLEPESIVPWGFGRRKTYNALTDDYE
jgi:hypothetical protein